MPSNTHPEIPNGIYCYEKGRVCPHWGIDPTKPEQDNGYCKLLGLNDWEDSLGLLWDQVKACGINDELEDEEMNMNEEINPTVVAVCQINVIAKRPDLNAAKIIQFIKDAKDAGASVAVFSEMALPGYMVGDDWEDAAFVADCDAYLHRDIREVAVNLGMTVIIGTVTVGILNYQDGRKTHFNSAVSIGDAISVYDKTNLPNYREFDDKRYFRAGDADQEITLLKAGDLRYTMSICEDGWDDDYATKPIARCAELGGVWYPHVHFNLSCSPFTAGKNGARNRRFAKHSEKFHSLVYVNNVGVQNNGKNVFVFDGSSTVYMDGQVVAALPPLVECMGIVTFTEDSVQVAVESPWLTEQKDPELHEVLTYAIKEFCAQSGIKRTVIGLSGGVDSALSVMLHVKALGAENVITVNMPTKFNSETTKGIAKEIAENLGVRYLEIPIGDAVDNFIDTVHGGMWASGVTSDEFWDDTENIQARMRGAGVQAMLAAGFKAVFPNNGNKAEVTVGYCTMGGDHMGYLAPIGDLWKSEVYETAKIMSATFDKPIIPDALFTIKPSAELSEAQSVDAGKGDPIIYWYHDKLFASWMEPWNRDNIEDTLNHYMNGDLLDVLDIPAEKRTEFKTLFPTAKDFVADLERWWTLFKGMGTVKRVQAPPTVVVSRRAFGFDFREAIGTIHYTRKYLAIKEKALTAP